MTTISVALVTNGRCEELLEHILFCWSSAVDGQMAVIGPSAVTGVIHQAIPWFEHLSSRGISFYPTEQVHDPARYGDLVARAMDIVPDGDHVILGMDDVLPLPHSPAWDNLRNWIPQDEPPTIRAIRMLDVEGRRWFDWARYEHPDTGGQHDSIGSYLQDYGEHAPNTYISGGCQLWSPGARKLVSYAGRAFGSGDDMKICWELVEKGGRLLPPESRVPTLIHLDRRYPGVGLPK